MTHKFSQRARSGTKRDLLLVIGLGAARIVAAVLVASRFVNPAAAAA